MSNLLFAVAAAAVQLSSDLSVLQACTLPHRYPQPAAT